MFVHILKIWLVLTLNHVSELCYVFEHILAL